MTPRASSPSSAVQRLGELERKNNMLMRKPEDEFWGEEAGRRCGRTCSTSCYVLETQRQPMACRNYCAVHDCRASLCFPRFVVQQEELVALREENAELRKKQEAMGERWGWGWGWSCQQASRLCTSGESAQAQGLQDRSWYLTHVHGLSLQMPESAATVPIWSPSCRS